MKYKIIVDKQSRSNPSEEKREYTIEIDELHARGNIYDSLVITKEGDYVMRRLVLNEYGALNVLETPVKEPLDNINIELFEGDNYIYLVDMVENKFYAEYLVKNDFTDNYVTKNEMNSAIDQTADRIELSVNQKLTGFATDDDLNGAITDLNSKITQKADEIKSEVSSSYATKSELNTAKTEIKQTTDSIGLEVSKKINNSDFTSANIFLKINNDKSEAKISADKVDIEGKAVRFKTNTSTPYIYTKEDADKIARYVTKQQTLTAEELELYDIDGDERVSIFDAQLVIFLVNDNNGKNEGSFEIDPYNARRCVVIKDYKDEVEVSMGNAGIYSKNLFADRIEAGSIRFEGENSIWINNEQFYMQSGNNLVEIKPTGFYIGIDRFKVPEILHGSVSITPSAANTPTGKVVTFEKTFSAIPDVTVNPKTGVIGTKVLGASAGDITTTGFTAFLTKTDTNGIRVNWIAVN